MITQKKQCYERGCIALRILRSIWEWLKKIEIKAIDNHVSPKQNVARLNFINTVLLSSIWNTQDIAQLDNRNEKLNWTSPANVKWFSRRHISRQRSFSWMAFLNLQATYSRSFVDPPRSLTPPKIHSRDLTCKAWITSRKMAVPWRRCKSFQDYLEKKLPDVVKLCRVTPCQFPEKLRQLSLILKRDQSRYMLVDPLKTRQRRSKKEAIDFEKSIAEIWGIFDSFLRRSLEKITLPWRKLRNSREGVFDFGENQQKGREAGRGESSKSQLRSDVLNVWELWTAYIEGSPWRGRDSSKIPDD